MNSYCDHGIGVLDFCDQCSTYVSPEEENWIKSQRVMWEDMRQRGWDYKIILPESCKTFQIFDKVTKEILGTGGSEWSAYHNAVKNENRDAA